MMGKQKNVPVLRFPEFGGEWVEKKLGDVAEINRGKSKHRPRDANFLYGGIYPFIQTGDIRNADTFITSASQSYSEEGLRQSKLWNEDTLCVTIAANIAETAILKIKACFPDSVIGILPFEGESLVMFLKIQFERFKIDIQKLSQGLAQANLNKESLSKIKFGFPTLPEQTKIATFLSSVDEKLQALKKKKAHLETYKKGLMQQLFSGDLRFKDKDGKDFPDWEEKTLGGVTTWASGGTPPKNNPSYWEGDIPWISASSMHGFEYGESDYQITREALKKGSKLAKKGMILILVRGSMLFKRIPVGITAIDVAFNQDVKSIKVDSSSSSEFVLYWFFASEGKLLSIVTGTGIGAGKLDLNELKSLAFFLPSLPEQQKIAKFLSGIDTKINSTQRTIDQTEIWKKGLLQKMFV